MPNHPILPPANYVSPVAVGYADTQGSLNLVGPQAPLPVAASRSVAAPPPLAGSAVTSGLAGPYTPLPDVPIHLQLSGSWTGSGELLRSTDGGATLHGLTMAGTPWARFTGNANEVVWQEGERGATFYLRITLSSGALTYRVSQ